MAADTVIIQRTRMAGSRTEYLSAWAPVETGGPYQVTTEIGGRQYGRLGSEVMPAEDQASLEEAYVRAYARILAAEPRAATPQAKRWRGIIRVINGEVMNARRTRPGGRPLRRPISWLASRLRQRRAEFGLSKKQLAEALGESASYLADFELDRTHLPLRGLVALGLYALLNESIETLCHQVAVVRAMRELMPAIPCRTPTIPDIADVLRPSGEPRP